MIGKSPRFYSSFDNGDIVRIVTCMNCVMMFSFTRRTVWVMLPLHVRMMRLIVF
nr:MAG TPA: hypothetical protein [Bacteriophage sp.]